MIKMSKGLMAKCHVGLDTRKKVLSVYLGPMPTREQLAPMLNEDKNLDLDALHQFGLVNGQHLGYAVYPESLVPLRKSGLMVWPFDSSNEEFKIKAVGLAQWFYVAVLDEGEAGTYEWTGNGYLSYVGDVGEIGDGTDMELLGQNIEWERDHRLSNLDVRLNV